MSRTKTAIKAQKTKPTNSTPKNSDMPKWVNTFLDLLANSSNVTLSAKGAGIDRTTAYAYRAKNHQFAAMWDDALDQSIDHLEGAAHALALQDKNPTMLIFLLKCRRPDIYGDKIKVSTWQDQAISDIKAGLLTYESLASLFDPDLATQLFMLAGVSIAK